jgi:hypothetical protein
LVFVSNQLLSACGFDLLGEVCGEEDVEKARACLSEYPSLLNADLTGHQHTPLNIASCYNAVSVVEYLLSCDGVIVNSMDKVVSEYHLVFLGCFSSFFLLFIGW